MPNVLLGISAFYHDSAAAIVVNGEILAAAQEERFAREKHTADFPKNAIRYCLDEAGITIDELDAVVFYDKPLLKFERLLETYYAFAPKGLRQFLVSMPVWLREKMFLKRTIRQELMEIESYDRNKLKLLFPEHHLSHAASAFYPSPYDEAAILTIDGVGEWATASISHGEGSVIKKIKELRFPHSVGLLYSAFTTFLGFRVNSGEYKLMGLAPYGNPEAGQTKEFIEKIKKEIVQICDDGSVRLNQAYFNYSTGLSMIHQGRWEKLFGLEQLKPASTFSQEYCNLAYAIQNITEEIILKMAAEAKRITGLDYLCIAGGVALNCVANGKLLRSGMFKDIWIQPAAGDAGGAVGAALAVHYLYYTGKRTASRGVDKMKGSLLGPYYSDKEILSALKRSKLQYRYFHSYEELCRTTADLLARGKVAGWFRGRMEYGPRALGNRSILADARNPLMQKRLNLKIKNRETFRPFAPVVLAEDAASFFDLDKPSPYMLLVAGVKREILKKLPEDYPEMDMMKKLYQQKSELPAITHVDFSARIQTVQESTNPDFWNLLKVFKEKTGYGVLVNTSFNVRDEPIVCKPEDAIRCFLNTDMDLLVLENYLIMKSPDEKA
ncbi:MAG: carbamoyltransferase [Balneolaceae bacterium]|nr:carbamoyltransferase [Balneolaceae bacterium]